MANLKYSRQREIIYAFMKETKSHPTADMVYEHVRKECPNISLGTVYRNLNLLTEMGNLIRIDMGDGFERFDGNTHKHYHFICKKCHQVKDLEIPSIDHIDTLAASSFAGVIEGHEAYFYGKCEECK